METPIRYGLIGCGGFGRFCLSQYQRIGGLECAGVADADHALAQKTADEHRVKAWNTPEEMLSSEMVDLVHLATPPYTHGGLGLSALHAGKHVLIEKPLATTMDTAQALVAASDATGRILAVNLMMRYNPLCAAVKRLIEREPLGEPLHAHFVNDAKDEYLPPEHWFWDRDRSGGIFVEHGVHFFDLFEWWFGPGRVAAAQQLLRPGTSIVDQVNCTAIYRGSIFVNFYHGFHQADRRDHQEWLIVFENGTLRMREWVPTSVELDFVGTDETAEATSNLFPGASLRTVERYEGSKTQFPSRHRQRKADARFMLTTTPIPKPELYGNIVRSLMEDQVEAIRRPGHVRLVSDANGVSSLACALEAQRLATLQAAG
jgi:predicted dehydrogenase